MQMVDLSTTYLGLKLKNPLVASASPLSRKVENVQALEAAGASAVVMYSLFEEQIEHESRELDYFLNLGTETYAEALTYFPEMESYNIGPEKYLGLISELKKSVKIPVIASLNGISSGGWVDYAHRMQEAGADALELNIYFLPTDTKLSAEVLEKAYVTLVKDVRGKVKIPLAVKLNPFFTSLPNFAQNLVSAGANGLVLFNRFYQPDLDIENLEVVSDLKLSTSDDLRLPLRWTAILHDRIKTDLALTGGVHNSVDVLKSMMAGANVAMLASELLENGIERLSEILSGMSAWMEEHDYQSVQQMRGSLSQKSVANPAAFERANYMKVLSSFDRRIK
jgi:dihydroorotate dehydrogenase (fumarate)